MPALTLRRSSHSSRDKPKLNKGAVIGGSIGGVYVVICVVVLILLMRRRKRRRVIREQLEQASEANHSSEYIEYHDHLNGKAPPSRSLVVTRSSYRPPTRRNQHGRSSSEGTVMRGGISNPFWMFGGIYEETESDLAQGHRRSHSSPHHRKSDSYPQLRHSYSSPHHQHSNSSPHHRYSTTSHHRHRSNSSPRRHQRTESDFSTRGSESFEIRPATAMSMQMHMPTSIFVHEMNARFPNAASKSQTASSQIRQVPPSPSPSSSMFREIVESQEEGPIPPIAIVPLMRKTSIDRIVSGAREKSSEKEREGPELIRVGTLNKGEKRKIVHVARNKSVSALSEKFLARVRKSRKGVLEDA